MLRYRTRVDSGASSWPRGVPRRYHFVTCATLGVIAVPRIRSLEAMPKVSRFRGDYLPMNVHWGGVAVRLPRKRTPIVISNHRQPGADRRERASTFIRRSSVGLPALSRSGFEGKTSSSVLLGGRDSSAASGSTGRGMKAMTPITIATQRAVSIRGLSFTGHVSILEILLVPEIAQQPTKIMKTSS